MWLLNRLICSTHGMPTSALALVATLSSIPKNAYGFVNKLRDFNPLAVYYFHWDF